MQGIVALVMCLVMLLGGTDTNTAKLATTEAFIAAMEQEGLTYSYIGLDDVGDEVLTSTFGEEPLNEVEIFVYFSSDLENVDMYAWYLMAFEPEQRDEVIEACNAANAKYRYVRFYVDDSDNSVNADLNYSLSDAAAGGEATVLLLCQMASIVNESYEYFAPLIADVEANAE